MTTPQEPLVLDAVLARNERASDTVGALCIGTECWVMRVPAQPDRDPDLVISASLNDVPALVAELHRARDDAAELRALLREAVEEIQAAVEAEYPLELRQRYRHISRRYLRDMELPDRIRAALAATEGQP